MSPGMGWSIILWNSHFSFTHMNKRVVMVGGEQSGRDLEVDFSQKQFKATELETLWRFLLVNTSFSLHTRKSCISSSHYTIYFYRMHIRLSYIRTRLCFPKTKLKWRCWSYSGYGNRENTSDSVSAGWFYLRQLETGVEKSQVSALQLELFCDQRKSVS